MSVPQTKRPVAAPRDLDAELAAAAGVATDAAPSQQPQDVWEYFAEHIDEFAVAKTICDHFDASPEGLRSKEIDCLGLYLRARVTMKRRQIAYADAMAAIEKAAESSRSIRGRLQRAALFASQVQAALLANPKPALIALSTAAIVWLR